MRSCLIRIKIRVNKHTARKKTAVAHLWSHSTKGLASIWDTDYYT